MNNNLSVIILTYNEEANIAQVLESVSGWAGKVFVLDSYSTDKTVELARQYECEVYQHPFQDYAKQRNYAIEQLPIDTEWILFLDADEWLTEELKNEIRGVLALSPSENGFYIKRRFYWMGKWIKRGYYPLWLLRLFRKGKASCEHRPVNEHLIVEGKCGYLQNDIIHEDRKGLTEWVARQNRFASLEAGELYRGYERHDTLGESFVGSQAERKRWLRHHIWNRMPSLIRPFFYFFYRYIIKGGFLDGKEAFIYHVLQGLWVPFLIDVKYLELKMTGKHKVIT
ncbi:MAG: glycosyltransferase family 2 protein [Nitrospirae bacterium]|nr:glycosyltransferase family 2 protein [Nitrospirota bacterium]